MLGRRLFQNIENKNENGNNNAANIRGPPRKRPRFTPMSFMTTPVRAPEMQPYYNSNIDPVFYDFGCTETNVGNVVRGIPPDSLPTPNDFPREIVTSMEALLDRPGIYTWILFADQTFVAARTFTPQEILSKHKNIHRNHAEKGILVAGECRIGEGHTVVFNLQSGTYMRPIAERFTRRFRGRNASEFYAEEMQARWRGAGATAVRFTSTPLLPTQISAANLATYEMLGYTFQRYPTMTACQQSRRGGGTRRRRRGGRKN